jgi:hypothetical protein
MAKLNWQKTQVQNRSFRYGLEIDPTVGADPNKAPRYSAPKKKKIKVVKNQFAEQKVARIEKPSVVTVTSTKIVEIMGLIKSEIGLTKIDCLDKLVKELHSNIIKLDKISRFNESVKLMKDAHHLLKNALLYKACSKKNPDRAQLIAACIADNSGKQP